MQGVCAPTHASCAQTSLREGCNKILRSDCARLVTKLHSTASAAITSVYVAPGPGGGASASPVRQRHLHHQHPHASAAAAAAAAGGGSAAAAPSSSSGAGAPTAAAAAAAGAVGLPAAPALHEQWTRCAKHLASFQLVQRVGGSGTCAPVLLHSLPAVTQTFWHQAPIALHFPIALLSWPAQV